MKILAGRVVLTCLVLSGMGVSAQKTTVHGRMAGAVNSIRLIDTHEHLSAEAARLKAEPSLFSLLHYVSSDMWADGLDRALSERTLDNASVPLEKQWELVAPYWANVRTTACGRSLLRAVRDLYGVADISASTYAEISRKVKESNRPGWYEYVLKRKAGIDVSITDMGATGAALDPSMFRAVLRLDHFLVVPQGLAIVGKEQGIAIGTLAEWEEAIRYARGLLRENAIRTFRLNLGS